MKLTFNRTDLAKCSSNSGFIIADFLFAFVLVIGIGIFIFAFTFSLATIEIAQYIVWSSARAYAAGNLSEGVAASQANTKFSNLSRQFPLLTGQNSGGGSWFTLDNFKVGDLSLVDPDFRGKIPSDVRNEDPSNEQRQPWTGASATITLKLFASLRIPFLGKVAKDSSSFAFPVRAFIIRSPSKAECESFFSYEKRFAQGIKLSDGFGNMTSSKMVAVPSDGETSSAYSAQEDNGC